MGQKEMSNTLNPGGLKTQIDSKLGIVKHDTLILTMYKLPKQ